MKYTARGGVSRGSYSTRRSRVLYEPRDTPRVLYFRTHKQGGALSVILFFLVVWREAMLAILGYEDISKCLNNLFVAVERTSGASLR